MIKLSPATQYQQVGVSENLRQRKSFFILPFLHRQNVKNRILNFIKKKSSI